MDEGQNNYETFLKITPLPEGEPLNFSETLFEKFITQFYKKRTKKKKEQNTLPVVFSEGSRNDSIFRLLCSKLTKFNTDGEITALAKHYNSELCNPPLDDKELEGVIANVCKYLKGSDVSLGGHSDNFWNIDRYQLDEDTWLKPLGHLDGDYYYITSSNLQITKLTAQEHSGNQLFNLMPKEFFHEIWGDPTKGSTKRDQVASDLMQKGRSKGIYSDRNIRGRGLWRDEGKIILHLGDATLDIQSGTSLKVGRLTSNYIYELRESYKAPGERYPGTKCGEKLVEIISKLGFKNKQDAIFLSGWVALSRVCGALEWRPHIWIVGGQGTGKSTIMNMLIRPLVSSGSGDGFFLGDSTVAGMKGKIKSDAIPIIFDEVDSSGKKAKERVTGVIEFIRQCSSDSDAMIYKGTASGGSKAYKASCMACFSSIRDSLTEEQDKSRFTLIELVENKDRWDEIKKDLENINEEFANELWSQMLYNFENVLESIRVIRNVLIKEHTARMADQYSALLGGYWHLKNQRVIEQKEAAELCLVNLAGNEHVQRGSFEDEEACKEYILQSMFRDTVGKEVLLYDVIKEATSKYGITQDNETLQLNGMDLKKENEKLWLYIRTQHPSLNKVFKDTGWANEYWKVLKRLPGSEKTRHRIKSQNAVACVKINISEFL